MLRLYSPHTCTDGSTVKRQLAKQIRADPDAFDMILHVGDFAYDMVRLLLCCCIQFVCRLSVVRASID